MIRFIVFSILIFISANTQATVYFNGFNNDSFQEQFESFIEHERNINLKNHSPLEKYFLGFVFFKGLSKEDYTIKQDKDKSISYFKAAWNEDVTDAGYTLARIYYHGVGVGKDIKVSKKYLIEAAEQGYVKAQLELGHIYWRGSYKFSNIVDHDIVKAEFWLVKAAEQGYADPAATLSKLYLSLGRNAEAFIYAKQAMEPTAGDKSTIFPGILANMYENGIGTKVDLVLAYKYYDLYGTAGGKSKNRIAKDMTDAEIQEAIRQSRAWQEEHKTFVPSYYGLQHQSDGSYR